MERKWLQQFYSECGREVSLAYTVLNQTNSWGITLVTVFLATIFLSAVTFQNGVLLIHYPTHLHWLLVVGAWIALIRFFVRSALALANMYRWNELIYSSSKVLSLPEDGPATPIFTRNCAKRIEAYHYRFRSPVKRLKLLWHSLKLMYLWFFIVVLALFTWGLVVLERNWEYYLGVGVFALAFAFECLWFLRWHGLQYEELQLEEEPPILRLWQNSGRDARIREHETLVLGFCEDGPYRETGSLLRNPDVNWLPWSYHAASLDPTVLSDLSEGVPLEGQDVAFASWQAEFHGLAPIIRRGKIDHSTVGGGHVRITVALAPYESAPGSKVTINNDRILCFYTKRHTETDGANP